MNFKVGQGHFRHSLKAVILGGLILMLGDSALQASEKVKNIRRDGGIELDSGKSLRLAGLLMPSESVRLLNALLLKKYIEWEPCSECALAEKGRIPAFIYVTVPERDMPLDPAQEPAPKRLMVNEFLLQTGAASVDETAVFSAKDSFLQLQSTAREKGYGVWSYQPLEKKPKKSDAE